MKTKTVWMWRLILLYFAIDLVGYAVTHAQEKEPYYYFSYSEQQAKDFIKMKNVAHTRWFIVYNNETVIQCTDAGEKPEPIASFYYKDYKRVGEGYIYHTEIKGKDVYWYVRRDKK